MHRLCSKKALVMIKVYIGYLGTSLVTFPLTWLIRSLTSPSLFSIPKPNSDTDPNPNPKIPGSTLKICSNPNPNPKPNPNPNILS